MWVRGLKLVKHELTYRLMKVAPYVGAWIETQAALANTTNGYGRTLCGCVD